jgi:hypothetical protein
MLSEREYVKISLETNVFFLRLSKEHAIFAAASLPPRDLSIVSHLMALKSNFEMLLDKAVELSRGIISPEILASGELVTDLTLQAENVTQFLTGLPINTEITKKQLAAAVNTGYPPKVELDLVGRVSLLNREVLKGAAAAIEFKTTLLRSILNHMSFSYTYPLMLDHVIRETKFFTELLTRIENREPMKKIKEMMIADINWNRIMGEHSKFIRGYLDPSEEMLFEQANNFAKAFDQIGGKGQHPSNVANIMLQPKKETEQLVANLRNFKRQGTEGILSCQVKGIMPPLLGDHVTREANHYLRLLRTFNIMA